VTFRNIHLNIGKYQAIVAGVALVLTAVQNPDGLTSAATGKGPAAALAKLRDRATGEYHKRLPARAAAPPPDGTAGSAPADGTGNTGGSGPNVEGDKHDVHHPVV
jgi:hypothetical protein